MSEESLYNIFYESDEKLDRYNSRVWRPSIYLNPYTTTEKDLIKRQARGKRGRFITQMYAGICASIGTFMLGMVIAWSSPITYTILMKGDLIVNYTVPVEMDINQYSWIVSVTALGCSIGNIPVFFLLGQMGPRLYMIVANLLLIILWVLMTTITSLEMFIFVRVMSGFSAISFLFCGETLIDDCTSKYYARYFLMFFYSNVILGIVITFIISDLWGKATTCIICCSICAVHIGLLYFVKDSPINLYEKNPMAGEKALAWYWGSTNIQLQLKIIKKRLEKRRIEVTSDLNRKYYLHSKVVLKGALMVLTLMFFEVLSGYYALIFYNVSLFKEFQHRDFQTEPTNAYYFGILIWILTLIAQYVHYPIPFGVKKPLLLSSILVTFLLASISLYVLLKRPGSDKNPYTIAATIFTLFVLFYECGLSYYPKVLLKDLMPVQIYNTVQFWINFLHWIMIFVMVRFFFLAGRFFGYFYLYSLLTVVSFLNIIYVNYIVIETKGKSLVQIQLELGGNPVGTRTDMTLN